MRKAGRHRPGRHLPPSAPAHRPPAPAHRSGSRFRPEIEGLRAVAAQLVAVYHIWLGRVSGGVDVPVTRWRQTLQDVAASALYVENWALIRRSVDYLERDAGVSPLQHFWAMSIQGQFYLLWALVGVVAFVLGRGTIARSLTLASTRWRSSASSSRSTSRRWTSRSPTSTRSPARGSSPSGGWWRCCWSGARPRWAGRWPRRWGGWA